MKAIEAFQHLPVSREQIEAFSAQLIEGLMAGEIEPLRFKVFLKGLEKVMENIKPVLDKLAREEAEKHGSKSFDFHGVRVELKETGTRYDFSGCGWPERDMIEAERNTWDGKLKECEKMLKTLNGPTTMVDRLTGEIVTVHPPVKSSTSSIQITFPKP